MSFIEAGSGLIAFDLRAFRPACFAHLDANTVYAADLFAGAGGASLAMEETAQELGLTVDGVAVNHWNVAVKTHQTNFPHMRHYLSDVAKVDPREAVPGGYLDVLYAGPECTFFSRASGKKAKCRQSRANATELIWWLESLYVQNVVIENVEEFQLWGPLDEDDVAIKSWAGAFFRTFVATLEELGYAVDWHVLNAADFGAHTTRKRLCLIATRHEYPVFPRPTHAPVQDAKALGLLPYRPAADIIDWSLKGTSIYRRREHKKQPLSKNTMRRINNGLRTRSGLPFIMVNRNNNDQSGMGDPLATLCTGNHFYYCEPQVVAEEPGVLPPLVMGQQSCASAKPANLFPVPTVATGGVIRVAEPYIVVLRNNCSTSDIAEPVSTLTTSRGHFWLAEAFLVGAGGPEGQAAPRSVKDPLRTVLTENHQAVIDPIIVRYNGGATTVAVPGECNNRHQSIQDPITTLDTSNRFGLASFLVSYHGKDKEQSLEEPLRTVETRDRFALVEFVVGESPLPADGMPDPRDERFALAEMSRGDDGRLVATIVGWIDILFRMLEPRELAAAQGFPASYQFTGNKENIVAQIGNAWEKNWGKAIFRSVLTREGIVYDKNVGKKPKPKYPVVAPHNPVVADAPSKEVSVYRKVRTYIDTPVEVVSESLFETEERHRRVLQVWREGTESVHGGQQ